MTVKSKKPGKQRKSQFNTPNHLRSKRLTVRLDDNLMEEWGIKRIPLRKDDEVRVIKGELEGVEGKVLSLNIKTGKVEIEECTLEKKNGATYYVPISTNNIVLIKFGGKKMDKWRQRIIDRKQKLSVEKTASSGPKKSGGK